MGWLVRPRKDRSRMTALLLIYAKGFVFLASLIVAIGAQNAFLLRQGIRGEHVFLAAFVSLLGDIVLVTIGCLGLGELISHNNFLISLFTWGGAAFLAWYAVRSFRSALRPQALEAGAVKAFSRRAVIFTALAVSWLNPHSLLDTVVLVGGVSGHYAGLERFAYAAGALTASATWFFGLAYGARAGEAENMARD